MIRTERKYIEILRILKDHSEPVGAKRLSEIMAERGFILTDRAVQYYLQYLDEMGFTEKVGNMGRVLTPAGIAETDYALVGDRIGFVISKLERLAFRTTFDPETSTGDVAYNLSIVPKEEEDFATSVFDEVIKSECGFFSSYKIVDNDPRLPPDSIGIMTICSISMDGVFQRNGIPVKMAYGGRLLIENGTPESFVDLIGYRGTTIDPLQLFVSAGLTSIRSLVRTKAGIALANVREVPCTAESRVKELISLMRKCGFVFPVRMGTHVLNLQPNPHRISIVSFSGMNFIANATEQGLSITTEIGAGNIRFSKIID
jgi:HTH-type transcriptional regulator, global nitrogen regulator NrpRI